MAGRGLGLLTSTHVVDADQEYVRVVSQRTFAPLDHHDTARRPDLLIEVYRPAEEPVENGVVADVVMLESKISSKEGPEQLKRYAEHLHAMTGFKGKALLYVTRDYDPKDPGEVLTDLDGNIRFKQLRGMISIAFSIRWRKMR